MHLTQCTDQHSFLITYQRIKLSTKHNNKACKHDNKAYVNNNTADWTKFTQDMETAQQT